MDKRGNKFGPKQNCPCGLSNKFCPLVDEMGVPTNGGKCWSTHCGQRFIQPSLTTKINRSRLRTSSSRRDL